MKLTVYAISGAPRPWRVLLALAFKGLNYEINYLEASKGEHKTPEFRLINPRATVPVLDADGLILRDSIGILAWLDRQFPDPPLFGTTPEEAASIWQITMEFNDYLRDAVNNVLFPILVLRESLPDADTEKRESFDASVKALREELSLLESLLDDNLYFGGQSPSAADAIIFPEIRLIQRAFDTRYDIMEAIGFGNPPELYPQVAAWKNRLAGLPGIDKTLPRHWSQ